MMREYAIITDYVSGFSPAELRDFGITAFPAVITGGLDQANWFRYPDLDTVISVISRPAMEGKDVLVLAVGSEFDPAAWSLLLEAASLVRQFSGAEILVPDTHASFISANLISLEVISQRSAGLSLRGAARLAGSLMSQRIKGVYSVASLNGELVGSWPWDDVGSLRRKLFFGAKPLFSWPVKGQLDLMDIKYSWKEVDRYLLSEMTKVEPSRIHILVTDTTGQLWAWAFMPKLRQIFPEARIELQGANQTLINLLGESAMVCVWL